MSPGFSEYPKSKAPVVDLSYNIKGMFGHYIIWGTYILDLSHNSKGMFVHLGHCGSYRQATDRLDLKTETRSRFGSSAAVVRAPTAASPPGKAPTLDMALELLLPATRQSVWHGRRRERLSRRM